MRMRGTYVMAAALLAGAAFQPSPAAAQPAEVPAPVADVAGWAASTGDNQRLPFMVLDKVTAVVFLYDNSGRPLGRAPVLIGTAIGDDTAPGLGDRELHEIRPEDRTTPAGRFVTKFGPALGKYKQVLWISYKDSVAMHPVITSDWREQRMKRLNSPTPGDNRITYGCINVAADFYNKAIRPLFASGGGIAYVLPESRQLAEVIPGFQPILAASPAR